MPIETNAMHARLRMEIYRQNWTKAVQSRGHDLRFAEKFRGSMTSLDEVKLSESASRSKKPIGSAEAIAAYSSITDSFDFILRRFGDRKTEQINAGNQRSQTRLSFPRSSIERLSRAVSRRAAALRQIPKDRPAFRAGDYETGKQLSRQRQIACGRPRACFSSFSTRRSNTTRKPVTPICKPDDLYTAVSQHRHRQRLYRRALKDEFDGFTKPSPPATTAAKTTPPAGSTARNRKKREFSHPKSVLPKPKITFTK